MGQIYSLTSDEAGDIMAAAIQQLKAQSKAAAISIVNRDGVEIAKTVMDGIRPFTYNVAFLKAKQAAFIGKRTSATGDEISKGEKTAELLGIDPKCITVWAGGVPIYDENNHLLGAIGISNLTQEEDDEIATHAIHARNLMTCKS